jgi:beta-lactamase superfamily II metal-dependent hydrolase
LFDYLESLTPDGEKPIVEAWVISHAHYDHIRVFDPLITKKEYADRIYVEGFYFNEPSDEANSIETAVKTELLNLDGVKNILKTTDGGHPEVYRIRTGERYYFNDITMDVMLTQEQLLVSDYEDGYNETSSWVLYTIEGQTVLIGGDAGAAGMKGVMNAYSQDYLTVNMFSALHHGHNTRGDFTKYCKVKDVVLYSERSFAGGGANEVLKEQAAESFIYGDGTKILTFPYTIGTTESLPCNTWQYHVGQIRPSL